MAKTGSVTHAVAQVDGATLSISKSYTGSIAKSLQETIADSVTDGLVNFALDVSVCQYIMIQSDQIVTLETNSGGAPTDTIVLAANVPYIWTIDSYFVNLITADITALYFTNASGSVANIRIESLEDATP